MFETIFIVSFLLNAQGQIEVVKRIQYDNCGNGYCLLIPSPPPTVHKEIYGVKDGKITIIETVEGDFTPSHYVEESIRWYDEPFDLRPVQD